MKSFTLPSKFWKFIIPSVLFAGMAISCQPKQSEILVLADEDKKAIETLARDLPLILSNEGWDAYEQTFSKNYKNWSMVGDRVRTRDEYLGLVKDWYDQGNRATGSELKTIDFIPLANNRVLYLYALQERFNDPADSSKTRIRDIRFVTSYTKKNGVWQNEFTAFMDKPEIK